MNKILKRALVLAVAFAAGLGIVFWINRQREETDVSYLQTQAATLPMISFTWRGEEINPTRSSLSVLCHNRCWEIVL